MSGAAQEQSNASTTKATTNDEPPAPSNEPKKTSLGLELEEDDEFEDFPVEDWGDEDTDMGAGATAGGADAEEKAAEVNTHLWEENWDDDDTNDDFAEALKEELRKLGTQNGGGAR